MFDTNIMLSSIIFGSIGMWYFIYWKKDHKIVALISGIILMIYPYFVTNIYYSIIIWIILMILPFYLKLDF
jgi:hypothetical protein